MGFQVNIFTAIIMLIVGIYDVSYAINRRHQPNKRPIYAYSILGAVFIIGGLVLLILQLLGIKVK
ncbi:hypothetical protein [Lactobacillus kalixensis]|uniref:Uncharacterized protein n=1 Tax=Lactobacillus kalixensis DSM 16043 TaxID=1423763 RepID=A0A0R1UCN6_9LACO|nr:hypothetical protein [Lactobacillus kalixensis]KRL91184.1 hypothetical protein FC46_GL001015 [Lactobacillus kalixensis DSM 16043]